MKVIGYVFDQLGKKYKYKYYFENDIKKVLAFLIQFKEFEVTITDSLDNLICKSYENEVLSYVVDEWEEELMSAIAHMYFKGITHLTFEEKDRCMIEV